MLPTIMALWRVQRAGDPLYSPLGSSKLLGTTTLFPSFVAKVDFFSLFPSILELSGGLQMEF